MADKADLIKAVRDHALANYEREGWDYLVECWEDDEISRCMKDAATPEEAIKRCREVVMTLDEQRSEVRAAGEW